MNVGCVPGGGSGIGQLIPSRISMRVCCSSNSDRFRLQAQCPLMSVARGSETRHIGVLSGQSRMQNVIPNTRPTRGHLMPNDGYGRGWLISAERRIGRNLAAILWCRNERGCLEPVHGH